MTRWRSGKSRVGSSLIGIICIGHTSVCRGLSTCDCVTPDMRVKFSGHLYYISIENTQTFTRLAC